MATFDLIGVPFPTTHPLFASDKQLQKKILQTENLIEMLHDMREADNHLNQLKKALEIKEQLFASGIDAWSVSESLGTSAVLMYAKAFVESQGRTQINPDEVFTKSDQSLRLYHDFFMDLRNKLFAHHELEANRHQLFVFPDRDGKPLQLNPEGQTERWLASANIDWPYLRLCIERTLVYLNERIAGLCRSIETSLTNEQLLVINKTPHDEMFNMYWRANQKPKKHPLSKRGQS